MDYLEIKNCKNFQHYKDRNPPWIKLHYELITSMDWVMWDDASKLLAIACMMIASRNEGKVPADEHYIQKVAHLQKKPDLKQLINSEFFVDASIALADASTKTETETYRQETETKPPISPPVDFDEFWKLYPSKVGKGKALSCYKKAATVAMHEEIIAGLKKYIVCKKVKDGYIMNPATWLNGGHWDDEYKPALIEPKVEPWVAAQR